MSLKKQALSGVFWTGIEQVGTQLINFIVSVILARLLLPEDFGLIGMIAIFMGIGGVLVNSGLTSSLIRSSNLTQEDYSTVFVFNMLGSFVVYIIIYFSAPYIAVFYNQEILIGLIRWYSLSIIIQAFSTVQQTRLTKKLDFKTQTFVFLPALFLGGIIGVLLALKEYGVWSLVVMSLVQTTVKTILLWYRSKWTPDLKFSDKAFKKHFNFGYKLTLSGLLEIVFSNIYNIIIGKFYSVAQVGYYQRANSLQLLPATSVSSVISKVSYPLFSQIKDDNIRFKRVFRKILKLMIFIIAPILLVLAVLAEPLFRFLFTEKWLPAVPYFQILVVTGILYPLHAYNLNIINVKGRSDLFLRLEIIKKVLFISVIMVAFKFGLYGLLYSSVLFSIIAFFINTYYSGRFINYSTLEQIKDIYPIILLSLLTGFIVYILDRFILFDICCDFARLALGAILAVIVYVFTAYFFKFESLTEINILIKNKN
jgi:O-antigen/teichoic acid export membrane protein